MAATWDPPPRTLFFDVFGTCVNWRKTVTQTLHDAAHASLNSPTASLSTRIRLAASEMTLPDWEALAQEWRNSYLAFTRSQATDPSAGFKTVDAHHLDSLRYILISRGLVFAREAGDPTPDALAHDGSLWDEAQLRELALVWHFLEPWEDTNPGLVELNRSFGTCTLTNGNMALLRDLRDFADMPFTRLFSAEMFAAYKPNAAVYEGAAREVGCQVGECVMVAAHLGDLKAAKGVGMRTVFVERAGEEREGVRWEECKGFVDVWVAEGEGGFVGLAGKLGAVG